MKMHPAILICVLLITICSVPLFAHHNILAIFDPNNELTVTGRFVQITWLNPRALLDVEVKGDDGTIVTWQVEMAGANRLSTIGFRKDTIVVPSSVTIHA